MTNRIFYENNKYSQIDYPLNYRKELPFYKNNQYNIVKVLNPKFFFQRPNQAVIFIDTYMLKLLFEEKDGTLELLKKCIENNKLMMVMNDYIENEIKTRGMYNNLLELCQNSLFILPRGYISANQIIHSLLCFVLNKKEINLNWDIISSKVPVIQNIKENLLQNFVYIKNELNFLKRKCKWSNKEWIVTIVSLERNYWRSTLKIYGDLLKSFRIPNYNNNLYEQFFYTDYFVDLPCIIFNSYFLGYILHERYVKIQDLVDVFTISELLPYCDLYVMDKDQHNRFIRLQKDYKGIFTYFYTRSRVISKWKKYGLDPNSELKDFIKDLMLTNSNLEH